MFFFLKVCYAAPVQIVDLPHKVAYQTTLYKKERSNSFNISSSLLVLSRRQEFINVLWTCWLWNISISSQARCLFPVLARFCISSYHGWTSGTLFPLHDLEWEAPAQSCWRTSCERLILHDVAVLHSSLSLPCNPLGADLPQPPPPPATTHLLSPLEMTTGWWYASSPLDSTSPANTVIFQT